MWPKHKMIFFILLNFIFFLFPKHRPDQCEMSAQFLVSESSFQRVLVKRQFLLCCPLPAQEPSKATVETLSERKLLSSSSSFLLELITRDSVCSCRERATQLGYIVRHEKSGILKAAVKGLECAIPLKAS